MTIKEKTFDNRTFKPSVQLHLLRNVYLKAKLDQHLLCFGNYLLELQFLPRYRVYEVTVSLGNSVKVTVSLGTSVKVTVSLGNSVKVTVDLGNSIIKVTVSLGNSNVKVTVSLGNSNIKVIVSLGNSIMKVTVNYTY